MDTRAMDVRCQESAGRYMRERQKAEFSHRRSREGAARRNRLCF